MKIREARRMDARLKALVDDVATRPPDQTNLDELERVANALTERRHLRERLHRYNLETGRFAPRRSHNRHLRELAIRIDRTDDGIEFWVLYSRFREIWQKERAILELHPDVAKFMDPDALNGYVYFPKRKAPKIPRGTIKGIAQYVPVHGGLTYAERDAFGVVWGFDTHHYNSPDVPLSDPDWIVGQCQIALVALRKAEELYPRYARASQKDRAEIGQAILDVAHLGDVAFDVLNPITILSIAAGGA